MVFRSDSKQAQRSWEAKLEVSKPNQNHGVGDEHVTGFGSLVHWQLFPEYT